MTHELHRLTLTLDTKEARMILDALRPLVKDGSISEETAARAAMAATRVDIAGASPQYLWQSEARIIDGLQCEIINGGSIDLK